MKKIVYYLLTLILFSSWSATGQVKNKKNEIRVISALEGVKKWFSAWEFVSKEVFKIDTLQPVEFVFFDEKNIYSTSKISIPKGKRVNGPRLFNKTLVWKKDVHHGKITLPDKQIVPVGLMSFSAPLENQNAFFIMPLPAFWKTAGVESKELGLDNLITGVFLHEFSHTQQMRNFGAKMSEYEKNNVFKVEFSDDIIQDYFGKDSLYNIGFREETKLFYEAASTKEKIKQKALIQQGLTMLESRQEKYFTGENAKLKEIDNFFLTMEGLGQYSMYRWLTHTKGGNLPEEVASPGVRRGGRWWSQEEGLALFLILDKLSKPNNWSGLMFGKETVTVIDLIKKDLNKNE